MNCSNCQGSDSKVIESRDVAGGEAIRRRRICSKCGYRFTTYEKVEIPQLVVIKNDGTRQLFSREKLLAGLHRASEKTSLNNLQLEELVSTVERQLRREGEPEVSSSKVGQLIMDELAGLNEVAYVRFASVYRRFKDIEGFEKELSDIKKRKTKRKTF